MEDERETYRVWHRGEKGYEPAADVEATSVAAAYMLTSFHPGRRHDDSTWKDNPGVEAMPGAERPTQPGDIIRTPDGEDFKATVAMHRKFNPFDGKFPTFEPTCDLVQQEARELVEGFKRELEADRIAKYGEADAATYEQRQADGCEMLEREQHNLPREVPVDQAELEKLVTETESRWRSADESLDRLPPQLRNGFELVSEMDGAEAALRWLDQQPEKIAPDRIDDRPSIEHKPLPPMPGENRAHDFPRRKGR